MAYRASLGGAARWGSGFSKTRRRRDSADRARDRRDGRPGRLPQNVRGAARRARRATGDGQVACTAGIQCDAQAAGSLQHALGRGAHPDLGSGSLGAKKVEQLVEEGVLRSAADLLDFVDARDQSLATLSALDGWGATSSEKVLDALETRAATPIARGVRLRAGRAADRQGDGGEASRIFWVLGGAAAVPRPPRRRRTTRANGAGRRRGASARPRSRGTLLLF